MATVLLQRNCTYNLYPINIFLSFGGFWRLAKPVYPKPLSTPIIIVNFYGNSFSPKKNKYL